MTSRKNRKPFAIIALVFAFVLTSAIFAFSATNPLNSSAYTAGAAPESIGSLTFSDYATREDGRVINIAVLDKLYGAILGADTGTYQDVLSEVHKSTSTTTGSSTNPEWNDDVQKHSMKFSEIAGGSPITLEFGGYKWNVVYLTTNTNDNSDNGGRGGDLIATLWMSENDAAVGNKQWSHFSSQKTDGAYASCVYSTSKIRIETLNGGSTDNVSMQYATDTSESSLATVGASDRIKNDYAKFTMSNDALASDSAKNNTSLVQFLATPSQVNYQIAENWVWSYNGPYSPALSPNDAWGKGTDGVTGPNTSLVHKSGGQGWWGGSGNINNMTQVIDNDYYYDWKNDYLWLPSVIETGYYIDSTNFGTSIWGIPNQNDILNSSGNTWLRSGQGDVATNIYFLSASGGYSLNTATNNLAVRPALHLNLSAVQRNLQFEVPKIQPKNYNGKPQGIENEAWFTNDFKNSVTVEYYDVDNKKILDSPPVQVGNYEVVITIKDEIDKVWSDGKDGKQRRIELIIVPQPVEFPHFYNNANSYPYAGGKPVEFQLADYDDTIISITAPTGINFDKQSLKVTVTDVKQYQLNVSLIDSKNYTWKTTDNKLNFEVTKAKVKLKLEDSEGNKSLRGAKGSTIKAFIEVDANYPPHEGKTVFAKIIANAEGLRSAEIASIDITNTTRREDIVLNLADLMENVKYTLTVVTDNAEYVIDKTDITTLDVLDASTRTKITWSLTADGSILAGHFKDAEVTEISVAFGEDIIYDGRRFGFIANPPDGYKLDTKFGVGGYLVECDNKTGNNVVGANADKYKTRIRLIHTTTSGDNAQEYVITWEVQKAKFDLSAVRWMYDGSIPYSPSGVKVELDSATLPQGLEVTYSGNTSGNRVGQTGTAKVEFALSGDYLINYVLPIASDTSTYDFTPSGSDFEWSKLWTIVPAKIPVVWKNGTLTDKNGKEFIARVLESDAYSDIIEYFFYETDSNGNELSGVAPVSLADMEVLDTVVKYYKTKVQIKSNYANSYEFEGDDMSDYYTVGEYSEAVEITIENLELIFNGKPQSVVIKILTGAIGSNSFDILYYDRGGVTPLSDIPMNVGEYRVEITLKEGVKAYLTGDNVIEKDGVLTAVIEYAITERIIDNSTWISTQKPPYLKVTYAEIQGLLYEYADADGNVITFSQLKPGNTYKVRALVKDRNNYKFKNDFEGNYYETDWVEFTVSENDQLYDPLDPNNPFYPEDPDNPNNPGTEDPDNPGGSVIDKIKDFFEQLIKNNFPLWQVATSAVALLLTLIFMIKAIQYGNRKKKAKGEAKKYAAKTYAAGLLPIFATDIVWLNLSNMVWSIIAFSLCGVMLLMFIIALITRKGWKKAELAKETAIEDSEQRKLAAEKQEREAEKQERREFQERIVQGGQFGGDVSGLEEILRKQREEMEQHYREELARRDEEQAKRDEAMKLMLANLMGRQQADGGMPFASMDDTDLIADKVFERLLPAVQQMMPETTAYLNAPAVQDEQYNSLVSKIDELQLQLANMSQERCEAVLLPETVVAADQSEEIRNLNAQVASMQQKIDMMSAMSVDDLDDEDLDDEEEWDSILDEEEDDFVEAVIIEEDGTVKKTYPNFRMRLKQSSDKNREWYTAIKNLFCSQKGITYRVYKRVEKIRYQGQVIAVIGIAKRSIKLWLALKPYEYDARRYHHKDVSDKPRFVDVPMYVRVSSDRALTRAEELILALFQELSMEPRKRYNDRSIQELIFTLKHNKLLTNKQNKGLLCEVMHVHDCDVLSDELAEKCIESKNVEAIDDSKIETLKLDDIDAKFQDGNRVTLEKLKKVGLVSEDCTGIKVIAGQRLTKPLIIVANEFTLPAVKMIALTGGRPIRLNKV